MKRSKPKRVVVEGRWQARMGRALTARVGKRPEKPPLGAKGG